MKNKTPEFNLSFEHEIGKGKVVSIKENLPLSIYIAQRIRTIQKEKKITSKKLFEKTNLTNASVISRIRKGSHLISIDTLYEICKGLDCKSSDILPF